METATIEALRKLATAVLHACLIATIVVMVARDSELKSLLAELRQQHDASAAKIASLYATMLAELRQQHDASAAKIASLYATMHQLQVLQKAGTVNSTKMHEELSATNSSLRLKMEAVALTAETNCKQQVGAWRQDVETARLDEHTPAWPRVRGLNGGMKPFAVAVHRAGPRDQVLYWCDFQGPGRGWYPGWYTLDPVCNGRNGWEAYTTPTATMSGAVGYVRAAASQSFNRPFRVCNNGGHYYNTLDPSCSGTEVFLGYVH